MREALTATTKTEAFEAAEATLPEGDFRVFADEGAVVALAVLKSSARIVAVHVRPALRRRGVGSKLLSAALLAAGQKSPESKNGFAEYQPNPNHRPLTGVVEFSLTGNSSRPQLTNIYLTFFVGRCKFRPVEISGPSPYLLVFSSALPCPFEQMRRFRVCLLDELPGIPVGLLTITALLLRATVTSGLGPEFPSPDTDEDKRVCLWEQDIRDLAAVSSRRRMWHQRQAALVRISRVVLRGQVPALFRLDLTTDNRSGGLLLSPDKVTLLPVLLGLARGDSVEVLTPAVAGGDSSVLNQRVEDLVRIMFSVLGAEC